MLFRSFFFFFKKGKQHRPHQCAIGSAVMPFGSNQTSTAVAAHQFPVNETGGSTQHNTGKQQPIIFYPVHHARGKNADLAAKSL
jgi:hypothetical protein